MRSYWVRMGPVHPILKRRENRGKTRHTGKSPCDDKGRDLSDMSTCQGTLRTDSNHLKLEKGKKRSPLTAFEGGIILFGTFILDP